MTGLSTRFMPTSKRKLPIAIAQKTPIPVPALPIAAAISETLSKKKITLPSINTPVLTTGQTSAAATTAT